MTHNRPRVDGYEPPAIIDDLQEPTWNIAIERYRERPMHDSIKLPIIEMMESRRDFGYEKHKTYLTPDNGRDSLTDALQEQLDCLVYLMNVMVKQPDGIVKNMLQDSFDFAVMTLESIYLVWSIQNEK